MSEATMRSVLLAGWITLCVGCASAQPPASHGQPVGGEAGASEMPSESTATTTTTTMSEPEALVESGTAPEASSAEAKQPCSTADDCVVTMWEGCCGCGCRAPHALTKKRLKDKQGACAIVDCEVPDCAKCTHSLTDVIPLCQNGKCVAHLAPVD